MNEIIAEKSRDIRLILSLSLIGWRAEAIEQVVALVRAMRAAGCENVRRWPDLDSKLDQAWIMPGGGVYWSQWKPPCDTHCVDPLWCLQRRECKAEHARR